MSRHTLFGLLGTWSGAATAVASTHSTVVAGMHQALSLVAVAFAIVASIYAIISARASARKTELELRQLVISMCRACPPGTPAEDCPLPCALWDKYCPHRHLHPVPDAGARNPKPQS